MISLGSVRKFVIGAALVAAPVASFASVFVSINIAPPELPIYAQPYCPGQGFLWTPGYWAYGEDGYFWVPGVWVQPPTVGYLWTPAYWGYDDGGYLFHSGYWGPHVGFYGGVNYGFGYLGQGYDGGYWQGNQFNYNRAVNNINVNNVHNTYVSNVTTVNNYNRVSYNGGAGGIQARPQGQDLQAQRDRHVQATPVQQQHQQLAAQNRLQLASVNGGRPQIAAARTPQDFRQNAVNARPADPLQRSIQGVRSGQATAGETHTLQPGAQSPPNQVQGTRQENSGVLTPQERQDLNQRQNNVNRSIYNNGQTDRRAVDPRGLPRQPYSAPQQQGRPQQQPQPLMQARPPQPMRQQPMQQQSRPQVQSPSPRPQMQEQRGGGGQGPGGGGYQRR